MENLFFSQEDNKTQTGPGSGMTDWFSIEKDAKNKDQKAQAIIELKEVGDRQKEKLKEISEVIQYELDTYKKDLKIHGKNLAKVNQLMVGITIAFFVSFIVAFSLICFDQIKEKDLYLKYNDLYQNYSEKNSQLKDEMHKQDIEINNLKNEIKLLKIKK